MIDTCWDEVNICLDEVVPRPDYPDRFNLSPYIRTRCNLVRTNTTLSEPLVRTKISTNPYKYEKDGSHEQPFLVTNY